MKILLINNYELEAYIRASKEDKTPCNHNWGGDYLIKSGEEVKILMFKQPFSNRLGILFYRIWFNLKLLYSAKKYDVIISFFTPIIDFFGLLRKLGFYRKIRLYTLTHHAVKTWELKGKFNKIFFISKDIMNLYKSETLSPMAYLEWGPDIPFYREYSNIENKRNGLVKFIAAGKTNRDDVLVEQVCSQLGVSLTLINSNVVKQDGNVLKTNNHKWGNILSYHEMLEYMSVCDVSIIPVVKSFSSKSLCGLTSFDDAIAMGHCILMSDNTNISVDIEGNNMGLIYKAGDEADLKEKLLFLSSHPDLTREFGRNARKYALEHSYQQYCEELYRMIKD